MKVKLSVREKHRIVPNQQQVVTIQTLKVLTSGDSGLMLIKTFRVSLAKVPPE